MVVVMDVGAEESQIEAVIEKLNGLGFDVHRSTGVNRSVLGAVGVKPGFDTRRVAVMDGVSEVFRVTEPYKFASRSWVDGPTQIEVGDVTIGGDEVVIIAGPCSVETEEQIESTAAFVAEQGARILRGGAFKPRSSPYSFQGMGKDGLQILRRAADAHGLLVITEVMQSSQIEDVAATADIIQVGARNMQNFPLLKELGKAERPIFLKRGLSATIEEWLMSAEYIMSHGNPYVILCERGIRTFETSTRNTLDLSAVPVVKAKSHLPVFVDPSHGVGIRNKVVPMARAAVAVGADGLMIEVHPNPDAALSDGPQSLYFEQFAELMQQIRLIAAALDRQVAPAGQSA